MSEHGWIEITALAVGGLSAILVLWTGRERGIGPQIRLTLAVCLVAPIIIILGLEKILSSETIAAVIGAFIGAGVPASGVGSSTTSGGSGTSSGGSQSK